MANRFLCRGGKAAVFFPRDYDVGSHAIQKLFPDFCGRLSGIRTDHLCGRMIPCFMGFPLCWDTHCYSGSLPMRCPEFYLSCDNFLGVGQSLHSFSNIFPWSQNCTPLETSVLVLLLFMFDNYLGS